MVGLRPDDPLRGADNTESINMRLPTGWDDAGEPSVFKKFLRAKIWQFQEGGTYPFTLSVITQLDFTSDTHSSYTETFTADADKEFEQKLLVNKAKALQFVFQNNVLHEVPCITGYEYEVAFPYRQEIKE